MNPKINKKKAKLSPNRNDRMLPVKKTPTVDAKACQTETGCDNGNGKNANGNGNKQCHLKDKLDSIEHANPLMFKYFEEDNLSSCASSVDEPTGPHEHATPTGGMQKMQSSQK